MPQHITVVDSDPSWPRKYAAERDRIAPALGDNLLAVWHIGSTAVPGLAAKPVIDIMAAVRSLEAADAAAERFAALGYEYLGEFGIPERRYLRRGGDERTHQVHIFAAGDTANMSRHLAFRDYLRAHADVREEYAALKRSLAREFPYDIDAYCDGKAAFVQEHEARALAAYDAAWIRLYLAASAVRREREISPLISCGGVSAALLTEAGNVYTGVSIDTACSQGMCAERAAVAAMLTAGESRAVKIAAVGPGGRAVPPCGACRELLMQLGHGAQDTEILLSSDPLQTQKLSALLPAWWQTV